MGCFYFGVRRSLEKRYRERIVLFSWAKSSPLKNRAWRRTSWTSNWKSLYKNSEGLATQHANLGTSQVVSLCSPLSTLCRRYITNSIRTIFYLNSLNIQICVSQHSRKSNGVGLRVVMRITSHNYDVTNVSLTQLFVPHNHRTGLPTTSFEIKYVRQT